MRRARGAGLFAGVGLPEQRPPHGARHRRAPGEGRVADVVAPVAPLLFPRLRSRVLAPLPPGHRRVPGLPGVVASNAGDVAVWDGARGCFASRVILNRNADGYARVRIGGRIFSRARLVCEAFRGPPPPAAVVRHLNGRPDDDRPGNLRWGTAAENAADRVRHGRGYVVRPRQVVWILRSPLSDADLARRLGLSRYLVWRVRSGRTFAHIRPDVPRRVPRRVVPRAWRMPLAPGEMAGLSLAQLADGLGCW